MDLQKVTAGQDLVISASDWNAIIDSAKDFQRSQNSQDSERKRAFLSPASTVLVKNTSGTDVNSFAVLGIDVPIFGPSDNLGEFQRRFAFKVVTPTTASHWRKFVITLEPMKNGALGRVATTGLAVVKIAVGDAAHDRADVTNSDSSKLTSGLAGGAEIVWKESGTGDKWAVVRLMAPLRMLVGKPGSDIAALSGSTPGSGSVTRWSGTTGAYSSASVTFTGYNFGGSVLTGGKFSVYQESDSGQMVGIMESCT